ncbi:MAG TPA: hypothetical protein PLH42_03770, partial [bacterium]|nr:hypothetical protein [bacterium]
MIKRCLIVSLMFLLILAPLSYAQELRLDPAPKAPSPSQYNSPSDYEKATGKKITRFSEAPELQELVKQGKLPAVEKRLPEKPLVVVPVEEV